MNEQTRYVMAIYEIGVIIRDSMEYLLPAGEKGYNADIYKQRKEMITHLTVDNSPFMLFCKNNKNPAKGTDVTIGERISSQVKEFISDVYGDESRIVRLDHDKVTVETSLLLQLMDYIIGLHETISDVCLGFRASFEKAGTLESDFDQLLTVDDPFYRSIAFRSVAAVFVMKFNEYNVAVRSYIASEREKNGEDPSAKPGFDPKVDPSCAFISNEMSKVLGFFNFLRQHNKSKDVIFLDSIERMQDQFHYFDGSKKLAAGEKLSDAMKGFELIFVPLIPGYRDAWVKVFNKIYLDLSAYEKNLIEKRNAVAAKPEAVAAAAKAEAAAPAAEASDDIPAPKVALDESNAPIKEPESAKKAD